MKIAARLLAIISVMIVSQAKAQYQYPFQNPSLPAEERISNLLSLMTLDEKVDALRTDPSVRRLGVKGTGHVEGLHGLAMGGPANWGGRNRDPLPTTTFPQEYGLGETWDVDLLQKVAAQEGYETRYIVQKYNRGGLVIRAPNADLGRDPRWGRTEECYGEDPFLTGSMTVAFVKGLQGNDPKYWQAASLMKHFMANSNEYGRTYTSSDFDERLWREYYSVPFRMGVMEGGSRAYMASYNKVNGIPATVHPMLKNITVKEWGQNGIICTDGGAYRLLLTDHKYFPDANHAAAVCIKAGINQFLDQPAQGIYGAIANGLLKETDIDEVLRGVYRVMIKLGMLDPDEMNPYKKIGSADETDPWTKEEAKQLALNTTRESIVLLKNDPSKKLLPLDKSKIKTIAVIGPRANEVLLDWYSGTPPYMITPLEGIKNKLGKNVEVLYCKTDYNDSASLLAKKADIAIVVVGNHPTCDAGWAQCPVPSDGKEAMDRRSIELEQEDLIKVVYKANPNTVVVLVSSFPYAINWTQQNVPAIVHMANNSQELGNGLADVLFGDYNPAGRLTQTWVKSITDLPEMLDYNIRDGRTYMYFKGEPLYPFGYGLSYSNFTYSNLRVNEKEIKSSGEVMVKVDIKNTGTMDGEEVVQLYVKHLNSKVERSLKALKAFKRIFIKAGETVTVDLPLKAEALAYWDTKQQKFITEEDKIELQIGASSSDVRVRKTISVVN
ncbi:MAG: glycoside hydrolase family 3 C-terminal domain-containing protein [Flavobacterium sp.]